MGPHNHTQNAGVISGNLSDRFLPITATFRVRDCMGNDCAEDRRMASSSGLTNPKYADVFI